MVIGTGGDLSEKRGGGGIQHDGGQHRGNTRHGFLVDRGADVNSTGEHQWTALHGAAYKGVDSVVQFLVEKGAKMDVFDEYGQTPLSIASAVATAGLRDYYYQRSQVLRKSTADLLLKLGATPLAQSGIQTR